MSVINQLAKKYVQASSQETGEELIKLAAALLKQANNLNSIGKAWSKTDESDTKNLTRHEGVAKLEIQKVMNTVRELNQEFGSK